MSAAKVSSLDFHGFISDLEASSFATTKDATTVHTDPRSEEALATKIEMADAKKSSFAGLFSKNRKLSEGNKLKIFTVGDDRLKLEMSYVIDVQSKLGFCLVGYIAGKFPGLKAIQALSQSLGGRYSNNTKADG
ncbi:UNVERIFIED_CONTAM: hypothetical protein Sangu_1182500 [Sesamum angustifolium]|uniref:Uncharacterized protein n=1 Tax=Sesamum angustifolium TaxID=2727405 RepID=A0AAW2NKF6_9LAMI